MPRHCLLSTLLPPEVWALGTVTLLAWLPCMTSCCCFAADLPSFAAVGSWLLSLSQDLLCLVGGGRVTGQICLYRRLRNVLSVLAFIVMNGSCLSLRFKNPEFSQHRTTFKHRVLSLILFPILFCPSSYSSCKTCLGLPLE